MIEVKAPVTIVLIIVNIVISLIALRNKDKYFYEFAEWPYRIVYERRIHQIVTSAFLHADFFHLFFNMFALYTFGNILENNFINKFGEINGSLYFAAIYLISLISGSILTVMFNFKNPQYVAIGASGAVSGIIFSFIIFYPKAMLGFFFIPMPAYIFAFLYVGISLYGMKRNLGNIGHEAHLGGALGGIVSTFLIIDGSFKLFLNHFK